MTRPDPEPLAVTSTERLSLRTLRVTFTGDLSVARVRPASYLSLWFSDPTAASAAPGRRPSDRRSFTPRFIDPPAGTMTIDFVLHGSGPASTWASSARPGDVIWAGEVTGGYAVPPDVGFLVLIGDDTAIPAIGTIVESLTPDVGICVIVEVVDELDERDLSRMRHVDPIWLHRGADPGRAGQATLNLMRELEVPADAHWWVAGEREAIRAMRDTLVDERGVQRDHYSVNAYWRLTETDPRLRTLR